MGSEEQKTVPCPTCGKPVTWSTDSAWRPFCSERCRLIDLGDWLDENHRISEPLGDQPEGGDSK
ncbi:MAG: DNA gyrase inhibitor YacG [Candidatus Thiodiazotropha sp.]